ncbi:MAG: glycosyl hydrolase family 18 protein [Eubacteriales bacterium]|nr:glycosyl hydrolase family 18 protein [Eubacteriales bacterium]
MDYKKKQKLRVKIMGIVLFVAVAAVAAGVIIVKTFMPTKEWMSGYEYFDLNENTDKTMVMIDGVQYNDIGVKVNDRVYLPQEFVASKINIRFYYDKETGGVLYTDDCKTCTFLADSTSYSDDAGNTYNSEYPIVTKREGIVYIDWEFVSSRTNCTYAIGESPSRISINFIDGERDYVTAEKDLYVRYRGGIKSKILEKIDKGTKLYYRESYDDWIEVTTPSGIIGYVQASKISEQFSKTPEDTYTENYAKKTKTGKVNLGWFQVEGEAGNSTIGSTLSGNSNINVISPTWYKISDSSGSVISYASSSFVSSMHSKGIEVWPLISDFQKDVDYKELYSSKANRTKLINRLMSDTSLYGYDGLNIDFENVKSEYAMDFLQFIRELSVECQKKDIYLSTDNYKPETYNQCYNLHEQSYYVDYIIIMAYDEHYAGSDAGSVSSLGFVKEAVNDTLALVNKEQVIVGIPFYTRVWTISGGKTTSKAVGMQAAIDEMTKDGQAALWNDEVGQYVCSYEKSGTTKKIWIEEDKSIEEKMKVIQESGVAGVAEWKLGLERDSVWSVINKYIN